MIRKINFTFLNFKLLTLISILSVGMFTHLSVFAADFDGDGIADIDDIDDDNDGILDVNEGSPNLNDVRSFFKYGGSARAISRSEVELTSRTKYQTGTVMSRGTVSLRKDFQVKIEAYFGNNDSGADGLTFILHNDPRGSDALGTAGQGLGAKGIQNGVYIEFDTLKNPFIDVIPDHTEVLATADSRKLNGRSGAITRLGNIEDGQWHTLLVKWTASTSTLSYSLDGIATKPYTNPNIVNEFFRGSYDVYFGSTAATGLAVNQHKIRNLVYEGSIRDSDGDGFDDSKDLDSDNDGIPDMMESGAPVSSLVLLDFDGDGRISLVESVAANGGVADADQDGLMDVFDNDANSADEQASRGIVVLRSDNSYGAANTDADTLEDFIDLDSDNDGIPDNIEWQTTIGFIPPLIGVGSDTNNNGWNDAYDTALTGNRIILTNTDGVDTFDYIDLDSDNDGKLDIAESGQNLIDANTDGKTDGTTGENGLDDTVDSADDYQDVNGYYDDSQSDNFTDSNGIRDVDYRDLVTPTVTALNTFSTTPVISGTHDSGTDLSVTVNGVTYKEGDGNLVDNNDGTWTLTIPASNALAVDTTYDVSATSTSKNSGQLSVSDTTSNELNVYGVAIDTPVNATTTNEASYPVSGSCSAGGSNVDVTLVGATNISINKTVPCDASGKWSTTVDVSSIDDGTNAIKIDASQTKNGVTGNAPQKTADKDTLVLVVAIDAPVKATTTNESSYPVSGSCTAGGGDVSVKIAGAPNITINKTVSCDANGKWSATVDVSGITDGTGVIDIDASQTRNGATSNAPQKTADKDTASLNPSTNIDKDTASLNPSTNIDKDSDKDGISDLIEIGVDTTKPLDTDGDGVPDYLDTDSDNDGYSDSTENGDFNNDGIRDNLQKDKLITSVNGVGGMQFISLLFILFTLLALRVQSVVKK